MVFHIFNIYILRGIGSLVLALYIFKTVRAQSF